MNRYLESVRAALDALPSEWLWPAMIFVLPILLLLLVKGLARISGRSALPTTKPEAPRVTAAETPPPETSPAPEAAAGAASEVPAEKDEEVVAAKAAPKRPAQVVTKAAPPIARVAPPPPAVEVEPAAEAPPPVERKPAPARKTGFLERLKAGLSKTRRFLSADIDALFAGRKKLDESFLEDLEELLITADLGVDTTLQLIEKISARRSSIGTADELKAALREEIIPIVGRGTGQSETPGGKPHVIMVVGVNGVGKTTTIGKLAARYAADGKKVLIAAADTFRAAAIEQLSVWAERAGADIVKHRDNADPAAVAFDSIEAAVARGTDIVLVDTAGRLHTKVNLMEELKKIKRTIGKKIPAAPHETLLVLDATTGQNALTQARMFNEALAVSGLALTKLDGTAKGGIVVGICGSLNIPLKYIGVGEKIDDLQPFDPVQFTNALF